MPLCCSRWRRMPFLHKLFAEMPTSVYIDLQSSRRAMSLFAGFDDLNAGRCMVSSSCVDFGMGESKHVSPGPDTSSNHSWSSSSSLLQRKRGVIGSLAYSSVMG